MVNFRHSKSFLEALTTQVRHLRPLWQSRLQVEDQLERAPYLVQLLLGGFFGFCFCCGFSNKDNSRPCNH